MDDAELNAIRSARLAELQKNTGQSNQSDSSSGKNDMKGSMLSQILEPNARERISRVRIVRPDRAEAVENYLLKLVQLGAISRKLSEQDIVEILDALSRDEKVQSQSKIVFDRRNDSDDDDFFD